MNYVDLNVVSYAAMVLIATEENGQTVVCEQEGPYGGLCGKSAEYLVPDATRPGGGGRDVEQRPAMFCREHLEKMLGHPPAEQSIFRCIVGPGSLRALGTPAL